MALDVIRRVAQGISDMHTAKIVHLHLKPHNILVNSRFEEVVLSDLVTSSTYTEYAPSAIKANTASQFSKISARYMSPEQVSAKVFGDMGPKSDVWALGCVLLHLCTDVEPYSGMKPVEIYMELVAK